MLDAFIIEEIRRREQEAERRREREQPHQELPVPIRREAPRRHDEEEHPDSDRGVVIIDYTVKYAALPQYL